MTYDQETSSRSVLAPGTDIFSQRFGSGNGYRLTAFWLRERRGAGPGGPAAPGVQGQPAVPAVHQRGRQEGDTGVPEPVPVRAVELQHREEQLHCLRPCDEKSLMSKYEDVSCQVINSKGGKYAQREVTTLTLKVHREDVKKLLGDTTANNTSQTPMPITPHRHHGQYHLPHTTATSHTPRPITPHRHHGQQHLTDTTANNNSQTPMPITPHRHHGQ
ncbi:hypothetical protein Btru_046852 [Bulinus truncatus]|nr:hypothetical protein Btru_046852 [Bulinus truncatus]